LIRFLFGGFSHYNLAKNRNTISMSPETSALESAKRAPYGADRLDLNSSAGLMAEGIPRKLVEAKRKSRFSGAAGNLKNRMLFQKLWIPPRGGA